MSKIKLLQAREILDSRGNPTVEAEIQTEKGVRARACAPSGASTGSREALELRDGDPQRFLGRGVQKAVQNVGEILSLALVGREVSEGQAIDQRMIELDGTPNKGRIGANAILATSLCAARAASYEQGVGLFRYLREHLDCPIAPSAEGGPQAPCLPAPMMNIINGGLHAANNLDIQEFMIVPHLDRPFAENLRAAVEVFHQLKALLVERNLSTNVGDEGGFAPNLEAHKQAIELILTAIERAHYRPGEDISLALDCAANEFYRDGQYLLEGRSHTHREMVGFLESLVGQYPIISIEDGLDEDDQVGWQEMTAVLGDRVMLVGDDLFTTNRKILAQGIERGQANAILIKPNQIGTLTETFAAMELAFQNGYRAVVSHRSAETADDFIADLAVATSCGFIKAGSACRSDRIEKYNQLLRLEEQLGGEYAPYHCIKV